MTEGTDFNDLGHERTREQAQHERDPEFDPTTEPPQPLRREPPPAEPYPLDALGETLGDMAKSIHAIVKAPAATCGQVGAARPRSPSRGTAITCIDGRQKPISLFGLTISEVSERKSGTDDVALWPAPQARGAARRPLRARPAGLRRGA